MKRLYCLFILFVPLCLLCGSSLAQAQFQSRKITGTVTDESGKPFPNVTIIEEGTTNGVLSDAGGRFTIQITGEAPVLRASFMGYVTQDIPVAGLADVRIVMREDTRAIEQVVVVGFGTQRKENLTGAVSSVDSKTFESRPVSNAVQALQGQVTGLNITQPQGGNPTSRASFDIRGTGTIGQGSRGGALVLIDGMEGDLFTVNPNDIESVSVLKDAAASSIYGAKAPFGVILVTTKKGRTGKATVSYNANVSYSSPLNLPRMMDSYTFALYFNEASRNGGQGEYFSAERLQRILDYQQGVIKTSTIPKASNTLLWDDGYNNGNDNIDYYRVFYRNLVASHQHNLSISGGGDRVTYFVSGNYLDQGGLMNFGSDGLRRFNVRGNFDAKVTRHLDISYQGSFSRENWYKPSNLSDNYFNNIGRQSWPVKPLYDPNGILFDDHVLLMEEGGEHNNELSTTGQQVKFTLKPLEGWRIVGEANYRNETTFNHIDYLTVYQTAVDGESPGSEWNRNSSVHESVNRLEFLNVNIYSDYERSFAGHSFKLLGGFQMDQSWYRDVLASKNGIMVPDYPTLNTSTGNDFNGEAVPPTARGGYTNWATAGFFGRLNYDYKGRYLIEANLRYDGSSRFRSDNRWGLFPSVSAGWNIAREEFMQPVVPVLNTFKFRGSFGSLGNQNTSSIYPTYSLMNYGIGTGTWLLDGKKSNISWPAALISTSLTWERVQSWNVGLDFGLLGNRLTGSADYFVRKTLDMVGPDNELPVILGTAVPSTNNTDLKTYGFEIELMWRDRLRNGLGYGVRLVISDSQTKILRYSNESGTLNSYYNGKKLGEIWGYETVGIARSDAEMASHLARLPNGGQGSLGNNWVAGDIMYRDLNGDGVVDAGSYTLDDHGDMRVIGNTTPRYNFGLDINLDWKGFDVRVFLQGTLKRDYFQGSYYFWGADSDVWWSTGLKQHTDYFRADSGTHLGRNLDSYYPRPIFGSSKNQQVQTRYLQNAAYMRLKNLQIGYSLPTPVLAIFGLSRARVYVSGENLFTVTKMTKLFDPETIGGYSGNTTGNGYPVTRIYSFGLDISF